MLAIFKAIVQQTKTSLRKSAAVFLDQFVLRNNVVAIVAGDVKITDSNFTIQDH